MNPRRWRVIGSALIVVGGVWAAVGIILSGFGVFLPILAAVPLVFAGAVIVYLKGPGAQIRADADAD